MANVQLQKTQNAATINKTAVDQKQSLEVVQTMLHGSLSTLSYLRNFFMDKAFDEQVYKTSDQILPYEDYANGKARRGQDVAGDTGTVMRVLRRNRSKRVDLFLDWLEQGAFAALKAGNLHSLQVYVHADANDREKVVETYTFTIKYVPHADSGRTLAGFEMDSPSSAVISVDNTNGALQLLLRQIAELCQGLPDLPNKRYISMSLFYVHDIVKPKMPKGFVPSTTDQLRFAGAEGWESHAEVIKELQSGHHSTLLKINHLQPCSYKLLPTLPGVRPPAVPLALRYDTFQPRLEDVKTYQSSSTTTAVADKPQLGGAEIRSTTPSTVIDDESSRGEDFPSAKMEATTISLITPVATSEATNILADRVANPTNKATSHALSKSTKESQLHDSLDTQSSNIPQMRKALGAMMLPESITQGDTQVDSHSNDAELSSPPKSTRPALSQAVAKQLNNAKSDLRQTARCLAKATKSKKKNSELVVCQCGHAKDEGDMVICVYCETWQHLHCYGYTGEGDERLPEHHACYACLLRHEPNTLQDVTDLALKRRGMHFAVQHGLRTQSTLASGMEVDTKTAKFLWKYLHGERYVVETAGSHKGGYAASGKALFVAVKEGPNHEKMLSELFDPMMHVSHLFELPTEFTTRPSMLTQRLLASQSKNMPPPATPASRMKRKEAQTPASGLDLRASLTPFETPSQSRDHQVRYPKRQREEDDETASSPPKRIYTAASAAKRLRSVQSKFVLDAGGLSSSPF